MHYLDNASTTRPAPEVVETVRQMLAEQWANPSALYRAGADAEATVAAARKTLAGALGCLPGEVFFTAGGTEANNIALLGAARVRKSWGSHLVATGYEHPSVLNPLRMLALREGFELTVVDPGRDGRVDVAALSAAVGPKTVLVAAMQVNNETGAILDVARLAATVKAKNPRCFVHVDGVQAFCKLPFSLAGTKIDGYATSAHKLHGPKGVGALFLKKTNFFAPFRGGGQERQDDNDPNSSIRPGTENTAYIAAYATAVRLALAALPGAGAHLAALRARLLAGLAEIPGTTVHSPEGSYPGIVFFSLPTAPLAADGKPALRSQTVLNWLDDEYDVQLSAGSACDRGQASHTLAAMGVPAEQISTALRASFCAATTEADVDALLTGLRAAVEKLAG